MLNPTQSIKQPYQFTINPAYFGMAPYNTCLELQEEEPQTASPMTITPGAVYLT